MVKKAVRCLDFGIFPGYVSLVYNYKHKELVKAYKDLKADLWLAGIEDDHKDIDSGDWMALAREVVNSKTGKKTKLYYIIIPEEFKFTDNDYAKLAHEVLHICQFYLPGVLNRNKEHEAEAYLHTHLMQQCLKTFRTVC